MEQRFTVIEGGAAARDPGAVAAEIGHPVSWRIDLRRAAAVAEGEVAAWRALVVRTGVADPVHADPDYLLSAAQHQAGGRDIVFALAWGVGGGPDRLAAVVPLALPHTLWGGELIAPWQPHGLTLAPLIAADSVGPVRAALGESLRALRPGAVLDLEAAAPPPTAAPVPLRAVARRTGIPADRLVGVRSGSSRVERIGDPLRIRDAVEEFLLLDAEVSAAPIIGDPSEAAMVRVVTRRFAQRRQTTVTLTRRDGAVVAGTITLGHGAEAVVWRQAAGASVPVRAGRRA